MCSLAWSACGATPKPFHVTHAPEQPRAGQAVRITVRTSPEQLLGRSVSLEYQLVDPGRYLALASAAYTNQWVSVPMRAAASEDTTPSAGVTYSAELSGSLQQHRRLVRYRIRAGRELVAPGAADNQPNFAFFVYDGVPAWRGAIEPGSSEPARGKPVTFSAELMRSVQVYHFLADRRAVENTTWYEPTDVRDDSARHQYRYTGTLVVDGHVYDHVRFRARGGEWRHAMGKNMWKFDFPRGNHLQARDDFGRPYDAKWGKLNLGACIQQGNYQRRGEDGLFEAVTFRLFNLAGVPAPHTHYVHLRIIDDAEESPASQYEGDFWGLYLATEEIDQQFLEEHGLPDGNLYKWDFGAPKPEHLLPNGPKNGEDVRQFAMALRRPQPDEWWRENVDLPRYFSYRSILECVHHYDIAAGKNYFYYFNTPRRQWIVLPWDVDLTWKADMFGTGAEPFFRAGVLRRAAFQIEYENRLREIRDLLFNSEETGALIEEDAAVISDPGGGRSFVDADRAKWDFHPIHSSRYVEPRKTQPGLFYASAPTKDFRGMIQLMKDFIVQRGQWCDSVLLTDRGIPGRPRVQADGPLQDQAKALRFRAAGLAGSAPPMLQWRAAEVASRPSTKPVGPRSYEIQAVWEGSGAGTVEIPTSVLKPGHSYRVRARACDADGRCGHWSEPVSFQLP